MKSIKIDVEQLKGRILERRQKLATGFYEPRTKDPLTGKYLTLRESNQLMLNLTGGCNSLKNCCPCCCLKVKYMMPVWATYLDSTNPADQEFYLPPMQIYLGPDPICGCGLYTYWTCTRNPSLQNPPPGCEGPLQKIGPICKGDLQSNCTTPGCTYLFPNLGKCGGFQMGWDCTLNVCSSPDCT